MKKLPQIVPLLLLLYSCDPWYFAYVRNYTDMPLLITIELKHEYLMRECDTLKSNNRIIEISANPKENVFDTLINTKIIGEKTMQFSVGKKTTTLIGSPYYEFTKVYLQNKLRSDTIILYGKHKNINTFLDKGILQIKKESLNFAYIIDINK